MSEGEKKFTGSLLLGMCNPLLDISAAVDQKFLDKYELKVDSAIIAEEKHQPLYEELIKNYPVKYIAGGAGQNSMRVAQWMLTAAGKPAETVAFMGSVGKDDEYSKTLTECATADGVLVYYYQDTSGASTGTCAALIVDKERSLCANLAAANNFKPAHLETELAQRILDSAQFVYITGFFLTVSPESIQTVAQRCCQQNKVFAMNLSAPFLIDFFDKPMGEALPYTEYVFGNESEAAAYGKKHKLGNDGADLVAVAKGIAALPKKNDKRPHRTVIITQGSKSTLVVTGASGEAKEYAVDALDKDKLVDTNGAGDAFVGGFFSQLVQGKDMEACVKAGHWAATYIIQQSGTTLSGPCTYKAH